MFAYTMLLFALTGADLPSTQRCVFENAARSRQDCARHGRQVAVVGAGCPGPYRAASEVAASERNTGANGRRDGKLFRPSRHSVGAGLPHPSFSARSSPISCSQAHMFGWTGDRLSGDSGLDCARNHLRAAGHGGSSGSNHEIACRGADHRLARRQLTQSSGGSGDRRTNRRFPRSAARAARVGVGTTVSIQGVRLNDRFGSFASSVLPAEAAPARNQTLQTFHEPLKNLLSKVAVRTRDARASK